MSLKHAFYRKKERSSWRQFRSHMKRHLLHRSLNYSSLKNRRSSVIHYKQMKRTKITMPNEIGMHIKTQLQLIQSKIWGKTNPHFKKIKNMCQLCTSARGDKNLWKKYCDCSVKATTWSFRLFAHRRLSCQEHILAKWISPWFQESILY